MNIQTLDLAVNIFNLELREDLFKTNFDVLRYPVAGRRKNFSYSKLTVINDGFSAEKYYSAKLTKKNLYILVNIKNKHFFLNEGFEELSFSLTDVAPKIDTEWSGLETLMQLILQSGCIDFGWNSSIRSYDGYYPLVPTEHKKPKNRAAVTWKIERLTETDYTLLPVLRSYRTHPFARRHEEVSVISTDHAGMFLQDYIYIYRPTDQGYFVERPSNERTEKFFHKGDLVLGPSVRHGKEDLNWMEFKPERKNLTRTYLIHKCIEGLSQTVLGTCLTIRSTDVPIIDRRVTTLGGKLSHKKDALNDVNALLSVNIGNQPINLIDIRLHNTSNISAIYTTIQKIAFSYGAKVLNHQPLSAQGEISSKEQIETFFRQAIADAPQNSSWMLIADNLPRKGFFDSKPLFYKILGKNTPRQSITNPLIFHKATKTLTTDVPFEKIPTELQSAFVNLAIKTEICKNRILLSKKWLSVSEAYAFVMAGKEKSESGNDAVRYFCLSFEPTGNMSFSYHDGDISQLSIPNGRIPIVLNKETANLLKQNETIIIESTSIRVLPPLSDGAKGWSQLSGILYFPELSSYAVGPMKNLNCLAKVSLLEK